MVCSCPQYIACATHNLSAGEQQQSIHHPVGASSTLRCLPSVPSFHTFLSYILPILFSQILSPYLPPSGKARNGAYGASAPSLRTPSMDIQATSTPSPTKYFWLCHCFLLYLLVFSTLFLCQYPLPVSSVSTFAYLFHPCVFPVFRLSPCLLPYLCPVCSFHIFHLHLLLDLPSVPPSCTFHLYLPPVPSAHIIHLICPYHPPVSRAHSLSYPWQGCGPSWWSQWTRSW